MKIAYKNIKRYKEIVHILIKYGFSFIVEKLNIENVAYKITNPPQEIRDMTTGQKIKCAIEELGPAYIKLGQILSTRKDLLDNDIINELSKLRDDVEVFDTDIAKQLFFEETGILIGEEFIDFNEIPIAAASIGQVYEAKLKNNTSIIIKIQRPNIEETIKSDIEILKKIAQSLEENKDFDINLVKIIDEFNNQLLRELDYTFEVTNAVKFKKMFKDDKNVYIPTIYEKYTTKKVLVMEKVIGVKLSDKKSFEEFNWNTQKISDIGVSALFKQIFEYGFFHADLHPGNIFVIKEDIISYIDFGMVGIIDKKTLTFLSHIIIAVAEKNVDKIVTILEQMDIIDSNIDIISFKYDILYIIHYYYDMPIEKISVSDILNEVFKFFRKYKIYLPTKLTILGKTIVTIEGTGRDLNPNFSIARASTEIIKKYYSNKFNTKNIFLDTKANLDELYFDLLFLPKQLKKILKNIENNSVRIELDELKFTKLEKAILDLSTKLSLSLVLASLVVGTSLIVSSPNILENEFLNKLAIGGFSASFIIGFLLVIKILKTHYKDEK